MNHRNLTLYHLPHCPFCVKVRRAATELGVDLDLVDVSAGPAARTMLFERRGRSTVPVLGIPTPDGEVLLGESDDIVAYLRREHGASTPAASVQLGVWS